MTFAREPLNCSGEFLMQNGARFTVCFMRLILRRIVTNGFLFPIDRYSGSPGCPAGHLANSFVSRSIIIPNFRIARVLTFVRNPKIFSSVVQAISINVVNKLTFCRAANQSVHMYDFAAIVSHILGTPGIHRYHRAISAAPQIGVPKIRLYQTCIASIYDSLLPTIKANKGKIAINANLSYTFFHLAGSFRWYGPVEAATSRPATIPHFAMGDKA